MLPPLLPFEVDDPVGIPGPGSPSDTLGTVIEVDGDRVHVVRRGSGEKHWFEARVLKNLRTPKTFMIVSEGDEPVACVIDAQTTYDRARSKARLLAHARVELKRWFPGKQFEIQPSRLILTSVDGEAHVGTYIAFEI